MSQWGSPIAASVMGSSIRGSVVKNMKNICRPWSGGKKGDEDGGFDHYH
jgi:hypothetical protein